MRVSLQSELADLWDDVQAATIPGSESQTATWCVNQLQALYDKFCTTHESRYADEITRLFQGMLAGLAESRKVYPEGQSIKTRLVDRLWVLHERYGLPRLNIKLPNTALTHPVKKTRKSSGVKKKTA